ncbi:hypothetical protein HanPSC8_Chr02g0070661 [Helianthus annuus]|nr:hypothetical protein HanPSC8_Chr02g0070661 [Helianthus annuus]
MASSSSCFFFFFASSSSPPFFSGSFFSGSFAGPRVCIKAFHFLSLLVIFTASTSPTIVSVLSFISKAKESIPKRAC